MKGVVVSVLLSLLHAASSAPAASMVGASSRADPPNSVYRLVIVTGDIQDAGTDANVFARLSSKTDSTGYRLLDTPSRDDFERGQTDQFDVYTGSLGELVRLEMYREYKNPIFGKNRWFLESVTVQVIAEGKVTQTCFYKYHDWFNNISQPWVWMLNQSGSGCSTAARS